MSALPEAVPLALAAAVNPPAILILILLLTGEHPRRLVLGYLAGAAAIIAAISFAVLFLLSASGATSDDSRSASASVDLVLGLVLVGLAVWAWRRRRRPPSEVQGEPAQGRMAAMSQRASASVRWAFVLGVITYTFSPLYVAAVKAIADSGSGTGGQLVAVVICAICVLAFIEIPAVVLAVRPDGLKATLQRIEAWLAANSWTLVAVLAAVAGAWLIGNAIAGLA